MFIPQHIKYNGKMAGKMKAVTTLLLLALLTSFAAADVYFSDTKVARISTRSIVEVGASPTIDLIYYNASGAPVAIQAAKFKLAYNNTIIDAIVDVKNLVSKYYRVSEYDPYNPGEIFYKIESIPGRTFTIPAGRSITLASIIFHVKQDAIPGRRVNLFKWPSLTAGSVVSDRGDVTGILKQPNPVTLEESQPPRFAGPTRVVAEDRLGRLNTGNHVVIDWRTAAGWDRTPFHLGDLSYQIFRRTAGEDYGTPLGGEKPFPDMYQDPADRAKSVYTGNDPTTKNIYIDDTVEDGVEYFYKVISYDGTAPNSIVQDRTAEFRVVPLDLTPPDDVTNLAATAGEGRVTLRWTNPTTEDLAGVLIVRNAGRPVVAGSPGRADASPPYNNGPEHEFLSEPFGPGNGVVITEFLPAFDPSEVPTEFVDEGAEDGVTNYYKVFTYDWAEPGDMGFNYSRGVSISTAAGSPVSPITNFVIEPGEITGDLTFIWDNPERSCDGVLIRYSRDDRLRFDGVPDAYSGTLVGGIPRWSGPGEEDGITLSGFSGGGYYVKAWAFNHPDLDLLSYDLSNPEEETRMNNDFNAVFENPVRMARTQFSVPVTASVFLAGGAPAVAATYTYDFKKGINHFAVPFPADRVTDKNDTVVDLSTWEKLIYVINTQAGGNVVLTLGRWNAAKQKAEGIVSIDYSKTGAERYITTPGVTANELVLQGQAFEIAVSKDFPFILKSLGPGR